MTSDDLTTIMKPLFVSFMWEEGDEMEEKREMEKKGEVERMGWDGEIGRVRWRGMGLDGEKGWDEERRWDGQGGSEFEGAWVLDVLRIMCSIGVGIL